MPHPQIAADNAPSLTAVLFGLSGCLVDFGSMAHADTIPTGEALATPGALNILQWLNSQGTPCAWLDELPPPTVTTPLAAALPDWIQGTRPATAPWPAPHACWQALMDLNIQHLDGCVLVSGEPRLLQAGLNAGLWTIGLASCGSLCGPPPQPMASPERTGARTQTRQSYRRAVRPRRALGD